MVKLRSGYPPARGVQRVQSSMPRPKGNLGWLENPVASANLTVEGGLHEDSEKKGNQAVLIMTFDDIKLGSVQLV